jgi:uncharacterized protein (DUF2252 family)
VRAFELARRQIELDREACAWLPVLFERKRARLRESPHAFLRGTARLFYEVLAARPELAEGPPGEGVLVGDMHLENVGAYRTDDGQTVFDLNDFDDSTLGPWRIDLLRAMTSVILVLHTFQVSGADAIGWAQSLLRGYREALFESRPPAEIMPAPMLKLVEKSSRRSKEELLDARAPKKKGQRHFLRGERYVDLSPALIEQLPALLRAYTEALGARAPEHAGDWTIVDAAQRIAGTGSLGCIRIAMLLQDRPGNERIVELKQEGAPSLEALVGPKETRTPSERVVAGGRALVDHPPRFLAALAPTPSGLSFIGRQLFPQEDKLALAEVPSEQLGAVARAVGRVLGTAHARGGPKPRTVEPWSDRDGDELLVRAIELAGVFAAIQQAYTHLT